MTNTSVSSSGSVMSAQSSQMSYSSVKKDAADPTMTGAELRAYYSDRIDMVDRASFGCGCPQYVLKGILDSLSYEKLLLKYPAFIRYTKEKYYEAYRKFFWLLNQERH